LLSVFLQYEFAGLAAFENSHDARLAIDDIRDQLAKKINN